MGSELSKRMRMRRAELGLTQGEVARQMGVSPSFVSQIERGVQQPRDVSRLACERWLMSGGSPPKAIKQGPRADDLALDNLMTALQLALDEVQRVQALIAAVRGEQ